MLQTLRLDTTDTDKASDVLKKYEALHPTTKYLLSNEGGVPNVKHHLQGWLRHDQTQKSVSQYIGRYFPDLEASKRSCTLMHTPPSYIPYIINNTNKEPIQYDKLITNYTEEEVLELQQKYEFIEMRKHKLKDKPVKHDFYTHIMDKLEESCVQDGVIQYEKLMQVYMAYVPKKVNARILYDNLIGYTIRLEYKYPQNKRARNTMYNQMCRLDDDNGIFKSKNFDYLKPDFT